MGPFCRTLYGKVPVRFPKSLESRRQWELALRRDGFVANDGTQEHFRSEDFDWTGQTVRLKAGVGTTPAFNFPAHLQRDLMLPVKLSCDVCRASLVSDAESACKELPPAEPEKQWRSGDNHLKAR